MGSRMIPCLAIVACTLAAGCAARKSSLTVADYQERAGTVRKIGIVMVGTGIRHLHRGGGSSSDADSSAQCASCAVETVEQALAARGHAAAALPLDRDYLMLLAAYRQVRDELFNASPSDTRTLPGIAPLAGAPGLCAKNGVDALVVVGACDQHFPAGGRAVFWDQALLRIYFGRGAAYADLAAVDRTGRIIHYSQQSGSYCTLSDQDGVHKVFDELVSGLPPAARR
jgi:hypothetical protein